MKIEFHKPKGGLWNVALFRNRYRRMAIFSATLGFLMLLLSSILVLKPVASQPLPGPHLRLHRGTFDARTATQLAPTAALAAPAPGSYAIIQLHGPITLADRQALEGSGVKILEYLPDYAYLVRGSPAQLNAAARLPQVYTRTSFVLADKLAPALLRAIARGDNQVGQVRIIGWPDDSGALARDLQARGLTRDVAADVALLLRVANLESVRWIEPAGRPRLVNDFARAIMNVDPVWQNHQLFGTDQIIAIADTGLDTGDMATLSPDFAGRIVATHVLSAGGDWADNHGHGTHAAGSVAGAGVQSGANPAQHVYTNSFAGVAPEASLVIQAFEASPDNRIIGLDPDYYQLFSQAYTDGARLHSDSWGDVTGPISDTAAAYGGYTYGSQRTDQFMWDHPDMAIFFAAGNSGKDGTLVEILPGLWFCSGGDGVIDPDSLIAPGTAKNVVTIGASESNRSSGGLGSTTWNDSNPYLCFATEPIASDLMADDPNGMAAFSSRGPADDGRVKPDIVAPGTNNVSNRSHDPDAGILSGVHETNPDYVYSSGTSRTTPLVAGAGALVRQWLINQGLANPSAAAVKAAMLNTTQDIAPGQYGTGPQQEIPFAQPNSVAGWGRADLGFIGAPTPYALWLDDHTAGLVTGQVISYTHTLSRPLTVLTNTQPLRVMLTWTDPPASLSAGTQLVNDLDLVVIEPGGATYYGNNVASGDRLNNVEGVVIHNPSPGQYRVEVHSFNVPIASQPYALAVGGPLKGDNAPTLIARKTAVTSAEVGQTITYTYRATNSGPITLTGVIGHDDKLGAVIFSPTTLSPNQSATSTLTYTVKASDLPGPLLNTVTMTGTTSTGPVITVTSTATAVVNLITPPGQVYTPAITVTKLADVSTAEVGQTITYTYWVTNSGNVTLTGLSGDDDKLGPVTFSPNMLAPDESTTGTLTYTISVDDLPGPLTNTVEVSGTTSVGPLAVVTGTGVATVSLISPPAQVYTPAITVTKLADVSTAEVDQTITYTYWVTNSGNITLSEVSGVDDKLGLVSFSSSTLTPDQSTATSLTYTVKTSDLPGPLTNTVIVSGTSLVEPLATVTATGVATVSLISPPSQVYTPAITVTKLADVSTAKVDQTITYTYWVTNSGTVTLTGLAGDDDKLGPITFSPNMVAPDESTTGTLTYTISVDDLPGPLTNTVEVSGTTSVDPPITVVMTGGATVSLISPPTQVYTPVLTVTKLADVSAATVDQTITYTYWVTNSGTVTLSGVTGTDDKLGAVLFSPNTLAPQQSATSALTYTIRANDLPGPLINTVEVSGTTLAGPLATVTGTSVATVALSNPPTQVYTPALTVLKLADVNAAEVGQTVTYTYRVTNSGNVTLTGLAVSDDKLGSVSLNSTSLVPEQSTTGTLTYTISVDDLPGPLTNTVEVSGTTSVDPPVTVAMTGVATVSLISPPTQVYTPAITVTKLADISTAEVDQTITYTYWVTNSGNVTLNGVTATDDKLGPVTFSPDILSPDQSTVASLTYTISVNDLPGPLTNTVIVSGTTPVSPLVTVMATGVATVSLASTPPQTSTPAISILKIAGVSTAEVGQTITYTYRVTNRGEITLSGVTGRDDKLGPITFNPSTLAPDESTGGSLTYTVKSSDLPGPLTNTVIVSGTSLVEPLVTVTATDTATVALSSPPTRVYTPALTVTKLADVSAAEVGQTVTYTYWVTNSGNVTLTGLAGSDDKLGSVPFNSTSLIPEQSTTGTLIYTIKASELPGPLINTVEVSGATLVGPLATVTGASVATVPLSNPPTQVYTPALTVAKLADVSTGEVGQRITYTYRVTNSGNFTLSAIKGSDDKLGAVLFSPSTLAPQQSATTILTYTIKENDLPGPLVNLVVVSGTTSVDPSVTVTTMATTTVNLQRKIYLPLILKT